jgi:glycosyltransferase involved in cell wall biosynthesis
LGRLVTATDFPREIVEASPPRRALRVVMFVYNDVTRDSRVLREAATLVAAGHRVTIMGRHGPDEREITRHERDGFDIVLVPIPHRWRTWVYRYRRPWRMYGLVRRRFFHHLLRGPAGWVRAVAFLGVAILVAIASLVRLPFIAISGGFNPPKHDSTIDWLIRWRFGVLGWNRAAAAESPKADVYHGHDLTALPAAIHARSRQGGLVVYDSHESFMDSGTNVNRSRWGKAILGWFERRQARQATALVTVNRSLGEILGKKFGIPRVVVVYNTPARWEAPAERPNLLREATGLPADAPIALYHGAFFLHRGLEELAAALLEPGLERVHAVYLGYGSREGWLRELADDPKYGGRIHVVPAVPPAVLPLWVASADVGVMPIQASTLNHRLSSPNKLFESLATGLPVVVSDFVEMRRIVLDDPDGPLGAVCDPADPASVAKAIRSILDLGQDERDALRARCLRAAHERWNWETESARLVALYVSLALEVAGSGAAEPASAAAR